MTLPDEKFAPPARFKDAEWENVPDSIKRVAEGMKMTSKGLYLHGGVGTGKTYIVYAIAKYIHDITKHRVKVYNSASLMDEIRAEFDQPVRPGCGVLDELLKFNGLVVIDDIGSEKMSEWVAERFYVMINRKYEKMIPMIFTSNLSLEELAERIGERTVSRIVEMCEIIELTGEDRRLK